MQALILCGGQGTRLKEETEYKPKPMVTVGGKPILWHIMQIYAAYGVSEFILALGYKGNLIREYFLNSVYYDNDFTITLGNQRNVQVHKKELRDVNWKVTLVDTGELSMTGARVKRCEKYLNGDTFLLTYGDGLADINIEELIRFHNGHNKMATITGIRLPSRFGELDIKKDQVVTFREKPKSSYVNGGFFVMNRRVLDRFSDDEGCVLESDILEGLAREQELMVYHHDGFWQCMDTYRDYLHLNKVWDEQGAPWLAGKKVGA